MLSVAFFIAMLSVIMLSVVMLNVVANIDFLGSLHKFDGWFLSKETMQKFEKNCSQNFSTQSERAIDSTKLTCSFVRK